MKLAGRASVIGLLVGFTAHAAFAAAADPAFTSWLVSGHGSQCSAPPDCGDHLVATLATFSFPQTVAVGPEGSLYVADYGDNEIRRISTDGLITTVAGAGTFCSAPPACGDRGPATDAHLGFPEGVAVDQRTGELYIADTADNEVRKVSQRGTISRVAGTGAPCATPRACGDGGPAASARLNSPGAVALDPQGNLYIADSADNEVRVVSPKGTIMRLAGDGRACRKAAACGDGGPATSAQLYFPHGLAVDRTGAIYIADDGDNRVRKVAADGTITTVAGSGSICASPPRCGDGSNPKQAQLSYPDGIALDLAGNLYIADQGDNEIRELSSGGAISTIAGTGGACAKPPSCGDGGAATGAAFSYPDGVAVGPDGNVAVADTFDHEIRWLSGPRHPPASIKTAAGKVTLLAFAADVSQRAVIVRCTLGASAKLVLEVSGGGRNRVVVASAAGHSGFDALSWNRHFGRAAARHGRYRFVVTATIGGHAASSEVRVSL